MTSCQRDREKDIATNFQEMEMMLLYEEHYIELNPQRKPSEDISRRNP